jgi:hypothetical protein
VRHYGTPTQDVYIERFGFGRCYTDCESDRILAILPTMARGNPRHRFCNQAGTIAPFALLSLSLAEPVMEGYER